MKNKQLSIMLVLSAFLIAGCKGNTWNSDSSGSSEGPDPESDIFPVFPDVPHTPVTDGFERYEAAFKLTRSYQGAYSLRSIYSSEQSYDIYNASYDGEGNGYEHENGSDTTVLVKGDDGMIYDFSFDEGDETSMKKLIAKPYYDERFGIRENFTDELGELCPPYYLLSEQCKSFFEKYELTDYKNYDYNMKFDDCSFESKTEKEEGGERYFSTVNYAITFAPKDDSESYPKMVIEKEIEVAYTKTIERVIHKSKETYYRSYVDFDTEEYTQTTLLRTGFFDEKSYKEIVIPTTDRNETGEEYYYFYFGDQWFATMTCRVGDSVNKSTLYYPINNSDFGRYALTYGPDDLYIDRDMTIRFQDVEHSCGYINKIYVKGSIRNTASVVVEDYTVRNYKEKYDTQVMTNEEKEILLNYDIPLYYDHDYNWNSFNVLQDDQVYDAFGHTGFPDETVELIYDGAKTSQTVFQPEKGTIHTLKTTITDFGQYSNHNDMDSAASLSLVSPLINSDGVLINVSNLRSSDMWFKYYIHNEYAGNITMGFKLYESDKFFVKNDPVPAVFSSISLDLINVSMYVNGEETTVVPEGFDGFVYFKLSNNDEYQHVFRYLRIE